MLEAQHSLNAHACHVFCCTCGRTDAGVVRVAGTNRTAGDADRVHGLNERLSIEDLGHAVCVYRRVLQLMAGSQDPTTD